MAKPWKGCNTSIERHASYSPRKDNIAIATAPTVSAGSVNILFPISPISYLFGRAQFTAVGSSQQFQSKDVAQIVAYLKANRDISDVLITGGDPMVMHAHQLARYVDAILAEPGCDHLATIRIGTKSLA